jgi:MFS family permease
LSSVLAMAMGPTVGFWVYHHGWVALCLEMAALNLAMAIIAWRLPDERPHARHAAGTHAGPIVEWRVMVLAGTLMLYSYSYGAITSFAALYAEANGVAPRGLYLSVVGLTIIATRPFLGRLGDRVGYVRLMVPCLALISLGLMALVPGGTRGWQILSAVVFGTGYGTAYPLFAAYVLQRVDPARRGAAFGAIIAAFDTGIGGGSLLTGWFVGLWSYQTAFGVGAGLSALAIPYFFTVRRVLPELPGLPGVGTVFAQVPSSATDL